MAELYLGVARARVGPAAALIEVERTAIAACEENRLTRARHTPTAGPPELALTELLSFVGSSPNDIAAVGVVDDEAGLWERGTPESTAVDGHQAHAAYAFHASGFPDAIALVSEVHKPRGWSAWRYQTAGNGPQAIGDALGDFPLARIYGQLTEALGFQPMRDEHMVEAMARAGRDEMPRLAELIRLTDEGVRVDPRFVAEIRGSVASAQDARTVRDIAASLQRRLGDCLVELLHRIDRGFRPTVSTNGRLCLSGGLFFNTYFTTIVRNSGVFDDVYVPPHPGRNGTALGAALLVGGQRGSALRGCTGSPYLGPGYSDDEIKEALDNCKLSYDFQPGDRLNEMVLQALSRGRLIGWFHGRLEWGPRALGHRSVLADPFAPHVLENLNGFLKRRPWYRSYGVSVPVSRVSEWFESGAASNDSPFMQFEYRPRDPERFRTILPAGVETLRVHTVDDSEPRFLRLLEMWGEKTGAPVLVNTSFNGFHEPLVCSPRDAIRVFYGTGLDVLALEDFLLRK
jgi:carbamoyltransferase